MSDAAVEPSSERDAAASVGPDSAHGRSKRGPLRRAVVAIVEHLRGLRRDHADLERVDEAQAHRLGEAKKLVKRRLLYCIAVSELIATFVGAPLVGSLFQYSFGSAYHGIAGTIIGDYVPGITLFLALWYALNRAFYTHNRGSAAKLAAFSRDAVPFIGVGIVASAPAYALSALLSTLYVAAAASLSETFAHAFPVPVVAEILNYALAELIYLYVVFKLVDRPVDAFLARYREYLSERFGADDNADADADAEPPSPVAAQ